MSAVRGSYECSSEQALELYPLIMIYYKDHNSRNCGILPLYFSIYNFFRYTNRQYLLFIAFFLVVVGLFNCLYPFVNSVVGKWSVGSSFKDEVLKIPILDPQNIISYPEMDSILGEPGHYIADPFFVKEKDIFYLFVELKGKENADIYCIGKKACGYFKNRNYPIALEVKEFWNALSYDHAMKFGAEIISRYVKGQVDHVQVIYNRFVNVAHQEIRSETFLPMSYEPDKKDTSYRPERLFEPSKEAVVKSI